MRFAAFSLAALAVAAGSVPVAAQSTMSPVSAPTLAASASTADANKAVVRQLYERVFNRHDVDAADALMRVDYIQHNPNLATGRDAFKQAFRQMFAMVPDVHVEILHIVAEGDLVVVHVMNTATRPGGGRIEQPGFDLFRVQNGLIAEHWDAEVAAPRPAPAAPRPES
ncbi:MAG: hypothetical protein JWM27_3603, partial [Gemmatimonadetes bacterium]|nr:hypothetical protein [Gemmatimonadota bacterium]